MVFENPKTIPWYKNRQGGISNWRPVCIRQSLNIFGLIILLLMLRYFNQAIHTYRPKDCLRANTRLTLSSILSSERVPSSTAFSTASQ